MKIIGFSDLRKVLKTFVKIEPYLNRGHYKQLIINQFEILHREVILALETEISSPATYGIVRVGAIVECKYGVVATLAKQCSAKATNC